MQLPFWMLEYKTVSVPLVKGLVRVQKADKSGVVTGADH
jgi:hypothetical protein